MSNLFNKFLYQPLFNFLILIYHYFSFGDLGVAIIIFTFLVRLILFPLFYKGAKDQMIIQKLAPKIKAIQDGYKENKEEQARALMNLYREHRVNPLSSILLIIIQLPILFALYKIFLGGLTPEALNGLYSFVPMPDSINHNFLGLVNLEKRSLIIIALAAGAQYLQGKLTQPKERKPLAQMSAAERMGQQMTYIAPIFVALFLINLPAAVGLYWLATSAFSVIQQVIINRRLTTDI